MSISFSCDYYEKVNQGNSFVTFNQEKLTNMENNRATVMAFYEKALTVNPGNNPAEVLNDILADDFISINTLEPEKSKQALINQIGFFWKLVPDLKWEPQEIIQEGNKFVVRSWASGTPNGNFMGLPTDGTKSFKIMTLDLHTIDRGKIKSVYHMEDWGAAMEQLKA